MPSVDPSVLYHGGVRGLVVGESIVPGHSRDDRHPDCRVCAQRAAGVSTLDPKSARPDRVYVTADRDYARQYASLYGRGDLYIVEPIGELEPSAEDISIPAWTVPSARVVAVLQRNILMTMRQRRDLYVRVARLEGLTKRQALAEFEEMCRAFAQEAARA